MMKLMLNGLDCSNCASKIEDKVNALPSVKEANMNFMAKKLHITLVNEKHEEDVFEKTVEIVRKLEPDVVVEHIGVKPVEEHSCGCGSSSCSTTPSLHIEEKKQSLKDAVMEYVSNNKLLMVGFALFFVGILLQLEPEIELGIYLVAYLLVGGDVLISAAKNILRGQVFDENFLMSIATIGALIIGEYPEAVAVMVFWQIGEAFQGYAVNNSRNNIKSLLDLKADYANLILADGTTKQVDPESVKVGDIVVVKPGEKVPLDGEVIEGKALMNTAALTGESVPRSSKVGDEVLSGFINENSLIKIKVTKPFTESTASKILDLVENASAKKSKTEQFITRFARYYTPVVVIAAAILAFIPPLLIPDASFAQWVERALIFLVVSCPCGLVVSIPLGFFGGIGSASKHGILVKGGNYLEALNNVTTVVFDKTGTLTKGVFNVVGIKNEAGYTKDQLLELTAMVESFSNHPIAKSIVKAYGQPMDETLVSDFEEISGHGIRANYSGQVISAGNAKLMNKVGIIAPDSKEIGTIIHVAVDDHYAGHLIIADELKEDVDKLTEHLHKAGIKKAIMLTGDRDAIAKRIAEKINLDDYRAELLPGDKVAEFERIKEAQGPKEGVIFVGDGINDAPVLARADIGISMGGVGSDAAIEASDIVLMTDELNKIVEAKIIASSTKKIVWQNIIFALGIKAAVLLLATLGMANMWAAIFADVGVAILAILNASRILKADVGIDKAK